MKIVVDISSEVEGFNINNEDIDNFINNYQHNEAALLSKLTDGVHLHTVEAVNEQVLEKIKNFHKEI